MTQSRPVPGQIAMILATGLLFALGLMVYATGRELPAFTLLFFAIGALPLWNQSCAGFDDVLRPHYCVAALLYLYSIATPLFLVNAGATYYGESVDPRDLSTYFVVCLAGVAGLSIGTMLGARRVWMVSIAAPKLERERRTLIAVGIAALVVGSRFIARKFDPAAATSYADVALALRVQRLADTSAGLRETLLVTTPVVLVLCAATVGLFHARWWPVRLASGTVIGLYVATEALSGWRGELMVALLIVGVYVHYRVRRFRWHEVVLGSLAIYVLMNGLALVRISSNPRQMLAFFENEVANRGYSFLAIAHSGELATSTNLLRLIAGIRTGETSFGWGMNALGQVVAFVPRAILPHRPDMGSELFVKTFYPGVFESGGGYGFFMLQDGYWDYGVAGVIIYCALYAFLLERLYVSLRARFQSEVAVFLYALLYSQLALSVVRSGMFASLKAAIIAAVPLLPIAIASRMWPTRPRAVLTSQPVEQA